MAKRLSADQARLRPHLRETARLERQAAVFRAEHARAVSEGIDWSRPHPRADGGDPLRLRGLPAIGAAASVSPGTDPVRALLAKERRQGR